MFITYFMYTIVTIIKVKGFQRKQIAFKECFNCFNCSFKLIIRKVMLLNLII